MPVLSAALVDLGSEGAVIHGGTSANRETECIEVTLPLFLIRHQALSSHRIPTSTATYRDLAAGSTRSPYGRKPPHLIRQRDAQKAQSCDDSEKHAGEWWQVCRDGQDDGQPCAPKDRVDDRDHARCGEQHGRGAIPNSKGAGAGVVIGGKERGRRGVEVDVVPANSFDAALGDDACDAGVDKSNDGEASEDEDRRKDCADESRKDVG